MLFFKADMPIGRAMRGAFLFLALALCYISQAATWYSVNGTSITNLANWRANTDGTGASPGSFAAGDIFVLQAGHTCTMAVDLTMAGTLTVNGVLNPPAARVIGGTGTLNGTGTIQVTRTAATADFASQYTINNKTLTNLTVDYAAASGGQTITSAIYGNVRLSNTSGTNTAGGNIVVNGTLTTSSGGTLNMTNLYTLSGTLGAIANNGIISTSVPTSTSATPLASGKTWGGTGTVIYASATGGQTVMAGTYNNLTMGNSSGTNTASGTIVATGILTTTDNGQTGFTTITLGGINATGSILSGNITLTGDVTSNTSTSPAPFLVTAASTALGGANKTFTIAPTTGISTNDANFGNITGAGGLVKEGLGNMFLSGASNTYTGGTIINSGTLATNTDNLGAVPGVATPGYITFNGGILDINADMTIHSNRGILLGSLGGQIAISANPSPTQQLVTYGGIMAGTGMFTKGRSGKLVLIGANTYTGGTNVARGTLNIQHAAALGSPTGGVGTTVTSGATLQLQGGITFNSQPLTLDGTGYNGSTGALNNASGNNTWPSTVTLAGASSIQSDAGTMTLSNANAVTGNNQNLTVQGAGNGIIRGTITTGTGFLTHSGTGTWTLGAVNTYTGATVINNSGVLKIDVDNAIGSLSAVNISASSGILDLNNHNDAVGSLAGSGTVRSSVAGNPTLTVGNDNTSTVFSGVVQNGTATSVSITKVGTGTMTISGSNTYTGVSTLTAGTLALGAANTLSSGSSMILNGATLSTGGFANTTGTLRLTDSSVIALGGGASNALRFSASNAIAWTAGEKLTITNWIGTLNSTGSSGTRGQVFVGTSAAGLTATQLGQVQFLISGVYYQAAQLSTGEIVPTNIPLPITLLYFTASTSERGARLTWATSVEVDSRYFEIKRSCDGFNWKVVGTVPTYLGSGQKNYTLFDSLPCTEKNYYKLNEVDMSGKHTEYSIAYMQYEKAGQTECNIYPNPTQESVHVFIDNNDPIYDLSVIDLSGNVVLNKPLYNGDNLVFCENLASGVYFFSIKLSQEKLVCKVVVF